MAEEPTKRPAATASTVAERRAFADALALRYAQASKQEKTRILNQVCSVTSWHRNHARKALRTAASRGGGPAPADPAPAGDTRAKYGTGITDALALCWTILDRPAGKRLAPMLPELVPVLRRHGELSLDDESARLLMGMSAATIDRRLASRRQWPRAASRTRPGSLMRNELPLLTWTEWDHTRPGFMELGLTPHGPGQAGRDGPCTVSVTDILTGWSENRTIHQLGRLPAALEEIAAVLPFPVLGLDCGNHGQLVDRILLRWCQRRRVTFTHARPPGHGSHHVGQQNWCALRVITGARRYGTDGEVRLLNQIWTAQSRLANYFYPQQSSVYVTEDDGRRRKHYETATPYRRTERHGTVTAEDKAILGDTYASINPAALHRHVQEMTGRLHQPR